MTTGSQWESQANRPRQVSPALAAILSFFIPGLGQIYAGRLLRGVLISIPQFLVLGVLLWIYLRHGSLFLASTLGVNAFGVAVVNVLLLVYRALAVIDAYFIARSRRGPSPGVSRGRGWTAVSAVILAVLLLATVGLHGAAAYESYVAYETLQDIFPDGCDPNAEIVSRECDTGQTPTPPPSSSPAPTETPGPTEPGATPAPTPSPGEATPSPGVTPSPTAPPVFVSDAYWAENGRLDLLVLGGDAGPGRFDYDPNAEISRQRFDAVHVASVDLATGRSSIASLPRYLQFPPLPSETAALWSCGCFRGYQGYLNALFAYAWDNPGDFPGGSLANKGLRALEGSIETLLGIDIDGIVLVDMNGFVDAVDAIGGIIVDVKEPVVDDHYDNEQGQREFVNIRAGWQHMDGHTALMYVRSRHQDSDIARIGRQQDFLRAMRRQVSQCMVQILPRLDQLLRAVGRSVRTDIPLEEVPALLDLLSKSKKPRRVELTSDNGFLRDLSRSGQVELYRAAMAAAFTPRPGDDVDEPEETPPDRLGTGC